MDWRERQPNIEKKMYRYKKYTRLLLFVDRVWDVFRREIYRGIFVEAFSRNVLRIDLDTFAVRQQ